MAYSICIMYLKKNYIKKRTSMISKQVTKLNENVFLELYQGLKVLFYNNYLIGI